MILAINILEPPLLVQFFNKEPLSIANGILTVVLALYTPLLSLNKKTHMIGFEDHWSWILGYTSILGSFYLFNDFYAKTPYLQKWLLFTVILPPNYRFVAGSTSELLHVRIYSLAIVLFMYAISPLRDVISDKDDKRFADFTKDKSDWIRLMCVLFNTVIATMIIREGNKNTVLGYLLDRV